MPWVVVSRRLTPPLPAAPEAASVDWYVLHGRMLDIFEPEIWRQLLVPANITMRQLHPIMIAAFGWAGGHMHVWAVRKVTENEPYTPTEKQLAAYKTELDPEGFAVPQVAFDMTNNVAEPVAGDQGGNDDDDDHETFMPDHGLPDDTPLSDLDDKYKLSANEHLLHYEYDMGDGWEHVIMVERKMTGAEVMESGIFDSSTVSHYNRKGKKRASSGSDKFQNGPKRLAIGLVVGGSGHGVAEDAGSYPGWDHLKEAYKAKNTKKDDEEYESRREWYEEDCGNGDPRGLKGKKRLEFFDPRDANEHYEDLLRMHCRR